MPGFFTWFRSRCVPPPCLGLNLVDSSSFADRVIFEKCDDYFAKGEALLEKENDMTDIYCVR